MPDGVLVTVPPPVPVFATDRLCDPGGAAPVLTVKERALELVGLSAVFDWFVTTRTRDVQPLGSNASSVPVWLGPSTAGSVLRTGPVPVTHTTVPRSWPPFEVFWRVTSYGLALVGSPIHLSA